MPTAEDVGFREITLEDGADATGPLGEEGPSEGTPEDAETDVGVRCVVGPDVSALVGEVFPEAVEFHDPEPLGDDNPEGSTTLYKDVSPLTLIKLDIYHFTNRELESNVDSVGEGGG